MDLIIPCKAVGSKAPKHGTSIRCLRILMRGLSEQTDWSRSSKLVFEKKNSVNFNWYDILGTAGVAVIILTYVLLQLGRVRSDQLSYSLLNAVGAALILISLYFSFNFPSFVVEFFWLLISLFGIGKYLVKSKVHG